MIKNYLEIQRTVRYFQSKEIDEQVNKVIFVLHGYAQNADDFLESVKSLASETTLVVAPEGLSKFYWKDFSSNPSSSWMTSLERENELKDVFAYFENLIGEIQKQLPQKGVAYSALGFSQGAAMSSRMVTNPYLKFSDLFLVGGGPAHDLEWDKLPKTLNFHLLYGSKDPFIQDEQVQKALHLIKEKGFEVSTLQYNGKHKMEMEVLDYVRLKMEEFLV